MTSAHAVGVPVSGSDSEEAEDVTDLLLDGAPSEFELRDACSAAFCTSLRDALGIDGDDAQLLMDSVVAELMDGSPLPET